MKLSYYTADRSDLKIQPIYRNEKLLRLLAERSGGAGSLPDAEDYYTTPLVFPKASSQRPYIVSSIVLSADGKMAFADNRQGPLIAGENRLDPAGADSDFWCLNLLRAYADAQLIGANTLRSEPEAVSNCLERELVRQRREVLHRPEQPWQVIVSLDGADIPAEQPTFHIDPAERLRVMIATSPAGWDYLSRQGALPCRRLGPFTAPEQVQDGALALPEKFDTIPVLVTGTGAVPDTRLMLYLLRRMGMELICAESPGYCSVLLSEGCLDEYFINYSMLYAGGTVTPGAGFPWSWKRHPHAELASVGIHHQNFLFTRQIIRYDAGEA